VGNFYTRREICSFSGKILLHIFSYLYELKGNVPVPVAARWVCGRLLAGIVGSNPAGDIDVFIYECCVFKVETSGSG